MKKLFSFLTVFALSIVFCSAIFAEKTTVYLKSEAVTVGQKANISVSIKDNFSLSYLHLKVSFFLDSFNYVKTQTDDCIEKDVPVYVNYTQDGTMGYIELEFGSKEGQYFFDKDGDLALIILEVKDNAVKGNKTIFCSGFNNDKSDALYDHNRYLNVEYENINIDISSQKQDNQTQSPKINIPSYCENRSKFFSSAASIPQSYSSAVPSTYVQDETGCAHKWKFGGIVIEADCENKGMSFYVCEYNSEHMKEQTVAPLGHKLKEKTVNGKKVLKCVRDDCDYVDNDYIASDIYESSGITSYSGADRSAATILVIGFAILILIFSVCSLIKYGIDKKRK